MNKLSQKRRNYLHSYRKTYLNANSKFIYERLNNYLFIVMSVLDTIIFCWRMQL